MEKPFKKPKGLHCSYCRNEEVQSLVKCSTFGCDKWFCNGGFLDGGGSHAVLHLRKSKHKQIELNSKNPFYNTPIKCSVCDNDNIFILGFANDKEILCRDVCNYRKHQSFDYFSPLIEDHFLSRKLLLKTPKKSNFSIKQAVKIEDEEYNLRVSEYQQRSSNSIQATKTVYSSPLEYARIYGTLIDLEAEYEKMLLESAHFPVAVEWILDEMQPLAKFIYRNDDPEYTVSEQDQVKIFNTYWECIGTVISISNEDEVVLRMRCRSDNIPIEDENFNLEICWTSVTYNRMKKGLADFKNSETDPVMDFILGKIQKAPNFTERIPQDLEAPGMKLNSSQIKAVQKALRSTFTLIQGPPGTGKTQTSATIVFNAVRKMNLESKVLVAAPSNIAVDNLAERLVNAGLKVVRVAAKTSNKVSPSIMPYVLENLVDKIPSKEFERLRELQEKTELDDYEREDYKRLTRLAEDYVLGEAEVICTTCVCSFDRRLEKILFSFVLIDEATQAIEPQCLLPITTGAEQVVLVGDHKQLGPLVISNIAKSHGLGVSMFERFIKMGNKPVMLNLQYRMHPSICSFPSRQFYENKLKNGIGRDQRILRFDFNWPNKSHPVMFHHVNGTEEIGSTGSSYLNVQEAEIVVKFIKEFVSLGMDPDEIGVVTPYLGQKAFLQVIIENSQTPKVQVESVDGFQGREKGIIIFSTVRSNDGTIGIGFLSDRRRMNVALTRAKFGLIIVGNSSLLEGDNVWEDLIKHYKKKGYVVTEEIEEMPSRVAEDSGFSCFSDELRIFSEESCRHNI